MRKLKTILLLLACSSFLFKSVLAQDKAYELKNSVINLGVGFGYSIGYISGTSASPVMNASYEYAFKEVGPGILGLGGSFSYQGSKYEYSDIWGTYKQNWNTTFFALRGTWHPNALIGEKYDVYGALQLGYYNYHYKFSGTGVYESSSTYDSGLDNSLGLGLIVGGRYFFTKNIGVYAELGYDIAYLKVGLSAKF
jgi:hypothetical protein